MSSLLVEAADPEKNAAKGRERPDSLTIGLERIEDEEEIGYGVDFDCFATDRVVENSDLDKDGVMIGM